MSMCCLSLGLLPNPTKALRMVTINAAKALGLDREVALLELGKKADVIVVDLNRPHLTPRAFLPHLLAYCLNGNDIQTVLDGRILMEDGQILSVNQQEVVDQATSEAEAAFTYGPHGVQGGR